MAYAAAKQEDLTMADFGFGEQLASARRNAGLSIQQVSDALRIRNDIVRAIEMQDFTNMPAKAFSRNQVSAYARYLGLDPNAVTRAFLAAYSDFEHEAALNASTVTNVQLTSNNRAYLEARKAKRAQDEQESGQRMHGNRRHSGSSREHDRYTRDVYDDGYAQDRGAQDPEYWDDESLEVQDVYDGRAGMQGAAGDSYGGGYSGAQRSGQSGTRRPPRSADGRRPRSGSGSGGSSRGSRGPRGAAPSRGGSRSGANRGRRPSQGSNRGTDRNPQNARSNRKPARSQDVVPRQHKSRRQRNIAKSTGTRSLNQETLLSSLLSRIDIRKAVIAIAVIIIFIFLVSTLSRCGASGSSTPNLSDNNGSSTVQVTGGSSTSESSVSKEQAAAITATPDIRNQSTTSFALVVSLEADHSSWMQIKTDDSTPLAEQVAGPQKFEYTVTKQAVLEIGNPTYVTVNVNNKKVDLNTTDEGLGTLTITRNDDGTVTTGE